MQMENNYLSDVTVSGRMAIIRSEAGKLQYIVSNDEFARGLNAQELLNRVPMVSMAGGRAMILGKGPARFMLNGRITEMGDEAIQQRLWTMHSEDIDRIEVISTPSGRDVIEMGGGYINIVMRRDQTLGWRGDVSAEAGISDDWTGRGSGSVSYASEKFDMTFDAHGGRTAQTTDGLTDYHVADGYRMLSDAHTKQTDKEVATNLTLRYLPTKNLELGGLLSWQMLWPDNATDGLTNYPTLSFPSEAKHSPNDNTSTKNLTVY
jgi:outer membrane receptor for ferrienterochelin and colicin